MIDEKKPFIAHLKELRDRLVVSLAGLGVAFIITYSFKEHIFHFLMRPFVEVMPPKSPFIFTSITEAFITYFKVSIVAALFLAAPVILYEIWMFVAPGLYEKEKKYVAPFIIFGSVFFIGGALFCYYVTMPVVYHFFVSYAGEMIIPMPSLKEYMSLTLKMLIIFGLIFQMPLVAYYLAKAGIINYRGLAKKRRYAILGIVVLSAIITPPEVSSQLLMALPMYGLFELSVVIARVSGKRRASMERLNCVILAAGKGTRMRSKLPKVAHPIMGRPMIRYVVETAQTLAPERIIVVTGHGKALVEGCLEGAQATFAHQEEQKGTAHALLATAPQLVPGDILVLYGDVPLISVTTLRTFMEFFRRSEGIAFMTTEVEDPTGYGRVIVDDSDGITDIVEDSEATGDVAAIKVINTGICMIRRDLLHLVEAVTPDNRKGEYYLTDICKTALRQGIRAKAFFHKDASEVLGINTRKDLLGANLAFRNAILDRHMENGVTITDRSTYIESDVAIGPDTVISPYCYLIGQTEIGQDVFIGPHVVIKDSVIENGVSIEGFTSLDGARIGENAKIGPFSRMRPKTVLKKNVKIGNFVELKNTTMGEGSKANHLSYIGDGDVGSGVNIGAGTITCNYDGKHKYRTTIGDGAFIGSNTEIVAPVTIGKDAYIGAGSTITRDVPEGALAVTRTKQTHIEGYTRRKKCAE